MALHCLFSSPAFSLLAFSSLESVLLCPAPVIAVYIMKERERGWGKEREEEEKGEGGRGKGKGGEEKGGRG